MAAALYICTAAFQSPPSTKCFSASLKAPSPWSCSAISTCVSANWSCSTVPGHQFIPILLLHCCCFFIYFFYLFIIITCYLFYFAPQPSTSCCAALGGLFALVAFLLCLHEPVSACPLINISSCIRIMLENCSNPKHARGAEYLAGNIVFTSNN